VAAWPECWLQGRDQEVPAPPSATADAAKQAPHGVVAVGLHGVSSALGSAGATGVVQDDGSWWWWAVFVVASFCCLAGAMLGLRFSGERRARRRPSEGINSPEFSLSSREQERSLQDADAEAQTPLVQGGVAARAPGRTVQAVQPAARNAVHKVVRGAFAFSLQPPMWLHVPSLGLSPQTVKLPPGYEPVPAGAAPMPLRTVVLVHEPARRS